MLEKIKVKFKDHVLTEIVNSESVKIFDFRRPDSGMYSQRWIINRSTLIVLGDCYNSIYQWSGKINLDFLATCDIGYFNSKCVADKDGEGQKVFDEDFAIDYLVEIASERILSEFDEFEDVAWDGLSLTDKFNLATPVIMRMLDIDQDEVDGIFYCENVFEGYEILTNPEHEFMFGSDAWEYGRGLETITTIPKMHLAALQVANDRYPNAF